MSSSSGGGGGSNRHIAPAPTDQSSLQTALTVPGSGMDLPLKPHPSIPVFLNKLYNMVCDRNSADLIRWAPDGNSFIVYRHEDFARDVLPRFFKHNNFSSFVRQLNMYGFHKVPHPMQGVLISDEPECWEFTNPNFRHGRPDLLPLVKRKSSRPGMGASSHTPTTLNNTNNTASGSSSSLASALLADDSRQPAAAASSDIASTPSGLYNSLVSDQRLSSNFAVVVSELTVLRQTQQTIADELRRMQQDNQVLWQETVAQRERHQKQQETIDKILRFLASVFSTAEKEKNNLNGRSSANVSESTGPSSFQLRSMAAKKKRRLLLEGGATSDSSIDEVGVIRPQAGGIGLSIPDAAEPAASIDSGFRQRILDMLQPTSVGLGPVMSPNYNAAIVTPPIIRNERAPTEHGSEDGSPTFSPFITAVDPTPPAITSTEALASNLRTLDEDLLSVTGQLGLTDDDLAQLDGMDVDDFLLNYYATKAPDEQAIASKDDIDLADSSTGNSSTATTRNNNFQ